MNIKVKSRNIDLINFLSSILILVDVRQKYVAWLSARAFFLFDEVMTGSINFDKLLIFEDDEN